MLLDDFRQKSNLALAVLMHLFNLATSFFGRCIGVCKSRQSPDCEYVFLLAEDEPKTEGIAVAGEVFWLSSADIDVRLIRSEAPML